MTQAERLHDALPTVARWTPRQLLDAALRQSQFLLAAAFILVSGLLTVAALVFLRSEEIASRERTLDTVTRAIEEQTTRTFQTVALGLEMTAADYQVLAQAGPPHPPAVRSLIQRQLAALPYVRSVWIADAKGNILHDTTGASVGRSVAERAYFRIYLAQPRTSFYIDKPARSSTNGNWRIAASVPLRRADDTFDGVLVAAIEPEFFDKLWNTMALGEGSSVALVHGDASVMVRSPMGNTPFGQVDSLAAAVLSASDGKDAGSLRRAVDGAGRPTHLLAFRRLSAYPDLRVVVGLAADTALAQWRKWAAVAMAVWLVTSLGLMGMAALLTSSQARERAASARAGAVGKRLELTMQVADIGVWEWDLPADQAYGWASYETMLGYPPREGPIDRQVWLERCHPDDLERVKKVIANALGSASGSYDYEYRLRHADGAYRWVWIHGRTLERDASGKVLRMVGVRADISARKTAEEALRNITRLYALRSKVNQAIVRSKDESALFKAICEVSVREGEFRMAWIGVANPQTQTLLPVTFAGYEDGYTRDLVSPIDTLEAHAGPAALALRHGGVRSSTDIALDPRMLPWRDAALQRGYRSFAGVAFGRGHEPVGVWSLYASEPGHFTPAECAVLEEIGLDISYALEAIASDIERVQAETRLRQMVREKEALLKEVHHRVKNNLQLISSLLRLESARDTPDATQTVLRDMQGRIQAMGLLHETLYGSPSMADLDLSDYLRRLATQSLRTGARPAGQLHLRLDLDPVQVGMDQAIPCGLLVNELISNCLKHAFPDGRSGEIRVELRKADALGVVLLRVSDGGIGFPADFPARRAQSLGLQLATDLAMQLGGQLDIADGPVAAFTVRFPLVRK